MIWASYKPIVLVLVVIVMLCILSLCRKELVSNVKGSCAADIDHNLIHKKRAVVVYVPNNSLYVNELWLLAECFNYIGLWESTDLVVFTPKETPNLPPKCVCIPAIDVENNSKWYNHIYGGHYKFMNSIECLLQSDQLHRYDWILRTDTDVFLTPVFKSWYPDKFTTGAGYYCHENFTENKLKGISKKLNMKHWGVHNIGSSWYGKTKEVLQIAKSTIDATFYIFHEEFKENKGEWPKWYMGVSLLYGGEIAVNNKFGKDFVNGKLDFPSSSESMVSDHPHIHCLQDDHDFSKLKYQNGHYCDIGEPGSISTVKDYCMYIAHMAMKKLDKPTVPCENSPHITAL